MVNYHPPAAPVSFGQSQLTEAMLNVCADILMKPSANGAVQQVCDEIVAQIPAIKLVWTWFGKADSDFIRPQTIAGPAAMYAHSLKIDVSQLNSLSPVFNPIHGHKGNIYPVTEHSDYDNWRKSALSHGVRSVFSVPLASENASHVGVMVLYANETDFFERMGTGLFEALGNFTSAILNRQRHERALEHMAFHDVLTGQMNRNGLYKALESNPQSGYCVMVDIDHFKAINDTYGHAVGDTVLSHLGNLIDRHTLKRRQLDRNKNLEFYATRWGGEEFFIFIGHADETQVMDWVECLRQSVSLMECRASNDKTIQITASFGVAYCPDSHSMLRGAIEHADAALYQAKANGRNKTVVFTHFSSIEHEDAVEI